MKRVVLIVVVLAIVLCGAYAYCQGPGGPGGPGGMGPGGPGGPPPPPPLPVMPPPSADQISGITHALGLTTAQATALKTVLATNDATLQPLMQAGQAADKALHDAFAAGTFDTAAGLVSASTDAEAAVEKASLTAWAAIKSSGILTDAQFTKLLAGPGGPPPCGPPPAPPSTGSGKTTTGGTTSSRTAAPAPSASRR